MPLFKRVIARRWLLFAQNPEHNFPKFQKEFGIMGFEFPGFYIFRFKGW